MDAAESGDGDKGAMVTLISSDNVHIEVDKEAASLSKRVARLMMTEGGARDGITVPDVDGKTLAKVLEYCDKHAASAAISSEEQGGGPSNAAAAAALAREELERFDKDFVNVVALPSIINAAKYLEIEGLYEIACQKVADMIKGKTPREIKETFGITDQFTPEEEEKICRENAAWNFDY